MTGMPQPLINAFVDTTVKDLILGDWPGLSERLSGMVMGLLEIEQRGDTGIVTSRDAPVLIGAVIDRIGSPPIDSALQAAIWNMSNKPMLRALAEAWMHAHPEKLKAFELSNSAAHLGEIAKGRSIHEEVDKMLVKLPPRVVAFQAFWDDEAEVWVATSDQDDITTEGATKEEIESRLRAIVPDLLESRHGRTGPLTILIDWKELRTVDQSRLALA